MFIVWLFSLFLISFHHSIAQINLNSLSLVVLKESNQLIPIKSNEFSTWKSGDEVNEFQLIEVIDVLGQTKFHQTRYHWDNQYSALMLESAQSLDESSVKLNNQLEPPSKGIVTPPSACENNTPREEYSSNDDLYGDTGFSLKENIFHGGHGDVWRAYKKPDQYSSHKIAIQVILKRMQTLLRPEILKCALREIYFGNLLFGQRSFTQLESYFINEKEHWLVFEDEGKSLQALLYESDYDSLSQSAMLKSSKFWYNMRKQYHSRDSKDTMKSIILQLIVKTNKLHESGITHRDLKPSNILVNTQDRQHPRLVISDFSSAIDSFTLNPENRLYPDSGPSTKEETLNYAPPEVLLTIPAFNESFNESVNEIGIPFELSKPSSYDVWSIGVIFLELILGTSDVFNVDQRTDMMIKYKLRKLGISDKNFLKNALLLSSLADYCLFGRYSFSTSNGEKLKSNKNIDDYLIIDIISKLQGQSQSSRDFSESDSYSQAVSPPSTQRQRCSLQDLSASILRRDPLGQGFNDIWGLDLLSRLLAFDPIERITLSEALNHAYFKGPYRNSVDENEHATYEEVNLYEGRLSPFQKSSKDIQVINYRPQTATEESLWKQIQFRQPYMLMAKLSSSQRYIDDVISKELMFLCPKCHRKFLGDWKSCELHIKRRKHANYCSVLHTSELSNKTLHMQSFQHIAEVYEAVLPSCLSDHSLLAYDPIFGWCDLQGRRQYIEDYFAIYYDISYTFYGVFDGHGSSFSARYAATECYKNLELELYYNFSSSSNYLVLQEVEEPLLVENINFTETLSSQQNIVLMNEMNQGIAWERVFQVANDSNLISIQRHSEGRDITFDISVQFLKESIYRSYLTVNEALFKLSLDQFEEDIGGTTASIALLFHDYLLVANVGDSRIIACCSYNHHQQIQPIQLTRDHTPYLSIEAHRIEASGGWIDRQKDKTWRVNGKLAVTRSLGDSEYREIVSPRPDVLVFEIGHANLARNELFDKKMDNDLNKETLLLAENQCVILYHMLSSNFKGGKFNLFDQPLFLIIASDGLWDVISNDEAIELTCGFLVDILHSEIYVNSLFRTHIFPHDTFQRVSKYLAHEALIRGSSDNIGVSVLDLLSSSSSSEYLLSVPLVE